MITDGQRFTVIFIFATILICGTFGLYITHAEDVGKLFQRGDKTDTGTTVYENDTYGFYFLYPDNLTVDTSACPDTGTSCLLTVRDEKVPVPDAEEVDVNAVGEVNAAHKAKYTTRDIFTLKVAPQHTVTHCDALEGRVEGGFTFGNTTYQPCVTPKTATRDTEGLHLETTLIDHTYTLDAGDYYGDRALLQGIFVTFAKIAE
jgi:hypothetical protein